MQIRSGGAVDDGLQARKRGTLRTGMKLSGVVSALVIALLFGHDARAAMSTDLVIRVTATSFRVGVTGVYTITVSNTGTASTDDTIAVTNTLPAGLGFLSSRGGSWTCSAAGQSVACTNSGPLAAGTSTTFAMSVSVNLPASPAVVNSFRVRYAGDTNPANNTVTKITIVKAGTTTPVINTPTATATTGVGAPTPTGTAASVGAVRQRQPAPPAPTC